MAEKEEAVINELQIKDGSLINNVTNVYKE